MGEIDLIMYDGEYLVFASQRAGMFGAITATVSPLPTPRPRNAAASAQQRRQLSAQVKRRVP